MPTLYQAPVEDFVFLIHDVFTPDAGHPAAELARSDTRQLLEQAARFFESVWAPLDAAGDREGCRLVDGEVRTPTGYAAAYNAYCAAGWNSVSAPAEFGGSGLPNVIGQAVREFASGACNALGLYGGLTNGAHATVRRTGEAWMSAHVLPKMVAGQWTGTMCLTEPHCGTDLRLMKARALPVADGSYRLSGTKIFISGGDHDLAENVIHLVLAKVPDTDGRIADDLSSVQLFLVSKRQLDPASGSLGAANGVTVGGVEHKMGLKGNATCTLYFEDAVAYRLGSPATGASAGRRSSAGMSGMFDMMNSARLGTGLQAVASAQRAYGHAATYARERLAGRAVLPAQRTGAAADPVIVHPDVRRLLLKQASFIEAARALGVYVRLLLDSGDARRIALGSLLTPVVKAYFSDRAFESANDALQVLGGHGYIQDNGIEQLVRDCRIFQLYEGANGVQALDLVQRKLPAQGGQVFADFMQAARQCAAVDGDAPELAAFARAFSDALDLLHRCADWLGDASRQPADSGGASYDFLSLLGIVACSQMWLLMARAAQGQLLSGGSAPFAQRKLALARYWFARELPVIDGLQQRIRSGSACLMDPPAHLF